MSSGRRIYPAAGAFDGVNNLTPQSIVYTDENGNVMPLTLGNNLSISNGTLNANVGSTFSGTYAQNIGTGAGLYAQKNVNTLEFKTLKSNAKMGLTFLPDSIMASTAMFT